MENTELTYPDLLLPPFWGGTERLPINAARITDNQELQKELDPAIIYAYIPVYRYNNDLVLQDPHAPEQELFTLSFEDNDLPLLDRFRPEGDLIVVAGVTLGAPSIPQPEALLTLTSILGQEIRKGLSLVDARGELLSSAQLKLTPSQCEDLSLFLGLEDRLDYHFEETPVGDNHALLLFIHNSSNQ